MHDYPDITAAAPAVQTQTGIPKEVLAAITRALSAELQAGRSVRLKDLGTWTPYINSEGKRSVVFHPERSIVERQTSKGAGFVANSTAAPSRAASSAHPGKIAPIPASFAPAARYSESQNEGSVPIDVGSLFEEVKQEYRLYIPKDAPAGANGQQARSEETEQRKPNGFSADASGSHPISKQMPEIRTFIEPQQPLVVHAPPADRETSRPLQNANDNYQNTAQSDALEEENTAVFQQHREQLFHPPEVRKPNTLNRLAFVLTMIVGCIIAYMMYTGGSFNSFLPEDLQHRQSISNRHSTQVRGSGVETVRGIDS